MRRSFVFVLWYKFEFKNLYSNFNFKTFCYRVHFKRIDLPLLPKENLIS